MKPTITREVSKELKELAWTIGIAGALALLVVGNGCGPIAGPVEEVPPVDCNDPMYVEIVPVDATTCPNPGDTCRRIAAPVSVFAECTNCEQAANRAIREFNDQYTAIETAVGVWTIREEGTGAPNVGRCQSYRTAIVIEGYETVTTEVHNPNPENPQSNTLQVEVPTYPTSTAALTACQAGCDDLASDCCQACGVSAPCCDACIETANRCQESCLP